MPAETASSSPQWAAFLESLKQEYPEEFNSKPQTLRAFLRDADQNTTITENFLDNPDPISVSHERKEEDEGTGSV